MVKAKASQARPGSEEKLNKPKSAGAVLIIAALDMSWRLAIVVLIPIIAGFKLDRHWHTTPALTIAGFIIAMLGVFLVMKQTVINADNKFKPKRDRQ